MFLHFLHFSHYLKVIYFYLAYKFCSFSSFSACLVRIGDFYWLNNFERGSFDLMFFKKLPILNLTLSFTHWQVLTWFAIFNQSFKAKFTASAILKPKLKPAWYPEHLDIRNSPYLWTVFVRFMPFYAKRPGKTKVVLCLINSAHSLAWSGNLDFKNYSNYSLPM